jgi:hypothetical protein
MLFIIAPLCVVCLAVSIGLGYFTLLIPTLVVLAICSIMYLLLIRACTCWKRVETARSQLLPLNNIDCNYFVEEQNANGETVYKINPLLIGFPKLISASEASICKILDFGAAQIIEFTVYTKHKNSLLRLLWRIFFFSSYLRTKIEYEIFVYPN